MKTYILFPYGCKHKDNRNKNLEAVSIPESSLVLLPSLPWRSACRMRLGINEKKEKPFGITFVFIQCHQGMLM